MVPEAADETSKGSSTAEHGVTSRPCSGTECNDAAPSGAPDGGWGWVIVLASFMIHVITDGMSYSVGVYVKPWLECFQSNRVEVGWLGSILIGVTWGSGPLASYLVNRYGCRKITIAGTFIAATGLFVSVFAPNIWVMYVSFGIVTGVGLGLMYLPSIVVVSYYFDKRRSCALGLAVCGAGIGTLVFAPLSNLLIDEYGWRGALTIETGLLLNCLVCGAVMRPLTVGIVRHSVVTSFLRRFNFVYITVCATVNVVCTRQDYQSHKQTHC